MEGVPQDVLETFEAGAPGGDNEGKLRFTFKYPDLFPTLKFALDSETRQKVFIQNENKVSSREVVFWDWLTISVQRKCPSLQGSHHSP